MPPFGEDLEGVGGPQWKGCGKLNAGFFATSRRAVAIRAPIGSRLPVTIARTGGPARSSISTSAPRYERRPRTEIGRLNPGDSLRGSADTPGTDERIPKGGDVRDVAFGRRQRSDSTSFGGELVLSVLEWRSMWRLLLESDDGICRGQSGVR